MSLKRWWNIKNGCLHRTINYFSIQSTLIDSNEEEEFTLAEIIFCSHVNHVENKVLNRLFIWNSQNGRAKSQAARAHQSALDCYVWTTQRHTKDPHRAISIHCDRYLSMSNIWSHWAIPIRAKTNERARNRLTSLWGGKSHNALNQGCQTHFSAGAT